MNPNLAELLSGPSLDQVRSLVDADFKSIDSLILEELKSDVPLVREIARYIVRSGGKRLRPLVVVLCAHACGYRGQNHIRLATLVEFLHTATLLHDDVVDDSSRRRGRKTVNSLWGNSPSILVGDFLYSRAFQLMVRMDSMPLMKIMSEATNVIAEGEVLQLENISNTKLSEWEYMDIIRRKTAMLFQASAHTAAELARVDPVLVRSLRDFGLHFGLAYQLIDDWLDYVGDSDSMGKNVGNDLSEGKATLPLIYAMKHGNHVQKKHIEHAIENQSINNLTLVIDAVRKSGALEYTRSQAERHTKLCIESLSSLTPSAHRSSLVALANVALCRVK